MAVNLLLVLTQKGKLLFGIRKECDDLLKVVLSHGAKVFDVKISLMSSCIPWESHGIKNVWLYWGLCFNLAQRDLIILQVSVARLLSTKNFGRSICLRELNAHYAVALNNYAMIASQELFVMRFD